MRQKKNKRDIIEIHLTKDEIDKLSEYLNADNFRNYGFGHLDLQNGDLLMIYCDALIKNREKYETGLLKEGMSKEELIKFLNKESMDLKKQT